MRTLPAALTSLVLGLSLATSDASAAETATASVTVNVHVASRTSLKVSSQVLRFDVVEPGGEATASIDFTAAARVPAGADVVLTVEPIRQTNHQGLAAQAVSSSTTFAGQGEGMLAGAIDARAASVAGRWCGSGRRQGRILFKMRANAAGRYMMPVRFVLSTP